MIVIEIKINKTKIFKCLSMVKSNEDRNFYILIFYFLI